MSNQCARLPAVSSYYDLTTTKSRSMNDMTLDAKACLTLLAGLLAVVPDVVFGGVGTLTSPTASQGKDTPLLEKSWCETPAPFELRVGVPGWLAGISGESGVKGLVDTT